MVFIFPHIDLNFEVFFVLVFSYSLALIFFTYFYVSRTAIPQFLCIFQERLRLIKVIQVQILDSKFSRATIVSRDNKL